MEMIKKIKEKTEEITQHLKDGKRAEKSAGPKTSENSRTLQKVTVSLSVICTTLALCFLVLSFSLMNAARTRNEAAALEVSLARAQKEKEAEAEAKLFADPAAVQAKLHTELGRYLDAMGDDRFNLAIAIESEDEAVTYYFNCEREQEAASLYKLPLAMLFADQITEGKLTGQTELDYPAEAVRAEGWNPISEQYAPGSKIAVDELIESSLTHSDNVAAAILYEHLGGWDTFAQLQRGYSGKSAVPKGSLDNLCTAYQVMDELRCLQQNPDRYTLITQAMDASQDDSYLNQFIEEDSMIQKYGQIDGVTNAAGFSKTGIPYRIVVLSESAHCELDPGQINEIVWNILNAGSRNALQKKSTV